MSERSPLLVTCEWIPDKGGVAQYLHSLFTASSGRLRVEVSPRTWRWFQWMSVLWRAKQVSTILVSHIFPIGFAAWLMSFVMRVPYVIILHGLDVEIAKRRHPFFTRWIVRRAKEVVVNSQALARDVQCFAQISAPTVLLPRVRTAFLQASTEKTPHPWVHLLTVARLVPRKNHLTVLRALALLTEDSSVPPWVYTVVGTGQEEMALTNEIKALGLSDRVRLTGAVDDEDLPRLYREADLFVLPTRPDPTDREGFGIVYLEAGWFGLPSVATDLPGVNEAVIQDETGWLLKEVEATNPVAVAHLLKRIICAPDRLREIGEGARARVQSQFTSTKEMQRFLDRL